MNSISKSKLGFLNLALVLFFLLHFIETNAQEGEFIKIENFIYNTDRLKKNDKGVIIQQVDRSLNDRIEFFIEETFLGIVESSKNIILQSYQTTTNPILKSHHVTFTVRVSLLNKNQNKEFRYLEIGYLPRTDKLYTNYIWDKQKRKFRLNDNEMERRSYLPNLSELNIENQDSKPVIDDLLLEYRALLGGVNDNFIYFNQAKEDELNSINDRVSNLILQQYPNVDFAMNIVFDSYHTLLVHTIYTIIIPSLFKLNSKEILFLILLKSFLIPLQVLSILIFYGVMTVRHSTDQIKMSNWK